MQKFFSNKKIDRPHDRVAGQSWFDRRVDVCE